MIPITLLQMNGSGGHDNLGVLIIFALVEVPAALVCFLLVDRKEVGRINLLLGGYISVTLCLFIGVVFLLNVV